VVAVSLVFSLRFLSGVEIPQSHGHIVPGMNDKNIVVQAPSKGREAGQSPIPADFSP